MNELITVNADTMTVSARDLHKALEIEKRFSAWFETNAQGFVEGEDYTSVLSGTFVNNGAFRELDDYECSLDMAKHICLMSRTEKGKQCRQYLINLEKAWNDPAQVMARALKVADQTIAQLSARAEQLEIENKAMQPKAIFADAVSASDTSILVRDLAKIIKQNGMEMGENVFISGSGNTDTLLKAVHSQRREQWRWDCSRLWKEPCKEPICRRS